jgi:hypothetical protein
MEKIPLPSSMKENILAPTRTTFKPRKNTIVFFYTSVNILPSSSVGTLETKIFHRLPPLLVWENTPDLSNTLKNFLRQRPPLQFSTQSTNLGHYNCLTPATSAAMQCYFSTTLSFLSPHDHPVVLVCIALFCHHLTTTYMSGN